MRLRPQHRPGPQWGSLQRTPDPLARYQGTALFPYLLTKQAVCVATQYASAPCKLTICSYLFARWRLFRLVGYLRNSNKLTFDLLTLKVVSESRATWATSVPILIFLGLSVLELGPMYATNVRQTDVRQKHRLMPPPYGGRGIINITTHQAY